ncbi:AI-2E family transporter [Iningainema tapete]|uniref:AI-2E family transporter n=1 Tax=Iningainema tapete BLCC-T55 TaxID=2748662 RepID=A0A8J7C566_9CYAN|nr:AI-2E family transporter [Iningainema tapete]MBD2772649.1 AI-2E family transporter [Iningainema tapete BLCC-T55]
MISIQKLPRWFNLGLTFPIIFINGWLIFLLCQYLQPIVSILLTASLIAFLLDYPIMLLEQRGMKRGWAVGLVLLLALMLLGVLGLILGPLVFQQLVEFGNHLPTWIEEARLELQALDKQTLLQYLPVDLSGITTELTNQLSSTLQSLTGQIISITLNTINSALNLLLTLVLTIFLVLYGKNLWDEIVSWLPSAWNTLIQASLKQSFQNYFAAQAITASILSVTLLIAFLVLQVPFALLFAFLIGVASLIPFGGVVSITLVSSLIVFQDVWLGIKVVTAAVILGQINETVVAPRLIGGITGLNPVVVVVSLLVGAKFGGVLGLLVAVPTTSFIKKTADTLRCSDWKDEIS